MFREEGAPLFDSRSAQMGHTLQGGIPSPRDRSRAVRLAVRSLQFLEQRAAGVEATGLDGHVAPQADTDVGVLVIESSRVRVANLSEMAEAANGKHRRAKGPWWLKMREVQVICVSAVMKQTSRHADSEARKLWLGAICSLGNPTRLSKLRRGVGAQSTSQSSRRPQLRRTSILGIRTELQMQLQRCTVSVDTQTQQTD
jgi:hypothetical protein